MEMNRNIFKLINTLFAMCFITLTHTSFAQATFTQATTVYAQTLQANTTMQSKSLIISEMQSNYPALYSQYMKGKKQTKTGWMLFSIGTPCLAFGSYMMYSNINRNEGGAIVAMVVGLPYMYAGVSCLAISVPFFIIGGVNKNFAVKEFKEQYYSSKASPYFQLNVYPNRMGIAYVF